MHEHTWSEWEAKVVSTLEGPLCFDERTCTTCGEAESRYGLEALAVSVLVIAIAFAIVALIFGPYLPK